MNPLSHFGVDATPSDECHSSRVRLSPHKPKKEIGLALPDIGFNSKHPIF